MPLRSAKYVETDKLFSIADFSPAERMQIAGVDVSGVSIRGFERHNNQLATVALTA